MTTENEQRKQLADESPELLAASCGSPGVGNAGASRAVTFTAVHGLPPIWASRPASRACSFWTVASGMRVAISPARTSRILSASASAAAAASPITSPSSGSCCSRTASRSRGTTGGGAEMKIGSCRFFSLWIRTVMLAQSDVDHRARASSTWSGFRTPCSSPREIAKPTWASVAIRGSRARDGSSLRFLPCGSSRGSLGGTGKVTGSGTGGITGGVTAWRRCRRGGCSGCLREGAKSYAKDTALN